MAGRVSAPRRRREGVGTRRRQQVRRFSRYRGPQGVSQSGSQAVVQVVDRRWIRGDGGRWTELFQGMVTEGDCTGLPVHDDVQPTCIRLRARIASPLLREEPLLSRPGNPDHAIETGHSPDLAVATAHRLPAGQVPTRDGSSGFRIGGTGPASPPTRPLRLRAPGHSGDQASSNCRVFVRSNELTASGSCE